MTGVSVAGFSTNEALDEFEKYGVRPEHLQAFWEVFRSDRENFRDAGDVLLDYHEVLSEIEAEEHEREERENLLQAMAKIEKIHYDRGLARENYQPEEDYYDPSLFDEDEDDYYEPDDYTKYDRSLLNGCEYLGHKIFIKYECENSFIPSSDFCGIKVINRFLELEGHNIKIPMKGHKMNPYAITKQTLKKHVARYLIKCECKEVKHVKYCSESCISEKIKKIDEDDWSNLGYAETYGNNFKVKNYFPSFSRLWVKDGKVHIKTINGKAQNNPKYCIAFLKIDEKLHHAILIKDYNKVEVSDILLKIGMNRKLRVLERKVKAVTIKEPIKYRVMWDIEASTERFIGPRLKNQKSEYARKFRPVGIRLKIVDNITSEQVGDTIELIRPKNEKVCDFMERSLLETHREIYKLYKENGFVISKVNFYAHNGCRFDNIFMKKVKNILMEKQIITGFKIKSLKATHILNVIDNTSVHPTNRKDDKILTHELKISFLDTYPFNAQSLDNACKTFKTKIQKEKFDIIDKSHDWFINHQSQENYDVYRDNKHKRVLGKNDHTCTDQCEDKCKLRGGNKDWRNYLKYDVDSLSEYFTSINNMYRDFGVDMTSYMGLPGIAWDLMATHCFNFKKLYVPTDPSLIEFMHASIYGGRILHFKKEFNGTYDSLLKKWTKYLICIDMNSLYPSVMYACGFPLGECKKASKEILATKQILRYPHYIIEAKIQIPNMRYGIYPYRTSSGGIIYPTNGVYQGVYNDVDIKEMLKDGCMIKEIVRGIYWRESGKIFTELVDLIYSARIEYKALGDLHPEFAKNEILKLIINSMFGKFGETIKSLSKFVKEDKIDTISKQARKKLLKSGIYEVVETLTHKIVNKPIHIAGYILSYAKALSNEVIRTIKPKNLYYSDTDSFYITNETFKDCKFKNGKNLCEFKNDYGDGVQITKAIFLDIKRCYLEFNRVVDSTLKYKGKPPDSCLDPITEVYNTGEPYNQQTYKCKFTGINFRSVKGVKTFENDDNIYILDPVKKIDEYKKSMGDMKGIAELMLKRHEDRELLKSCKNDSDKIVLADVLGYKDFKPRINNKLASRKILFEFNGVQIEKNALEFHEMHDDIKFMMERFIKMGKDVLINTKEYNFSISPHRRANWNKKIYYAKGFNRKDTEYVPEYKGKIGDLVASFSHLNATSFDLNVNEKSISIRSLRPLFYEENFKANELFNRMKNPTKYIDNNNHNIIEYNKIYNDRTKLKEFLINFINEGKKVTTEIINILNDCKRPDKALHNKLVKYKDFMTKLDNEYFKDDLVEVNRLNMSDIIISTKEKIYTDIYIQFNEPQTNDSVTPFNDYKSSPFKLLLKTVGFSGGKKQYDYYELNRIGVKGKITDVSNIYPVIAISQKYRKLYGKNNITNIQALNLIKNTC